MVFGLLGARGRVVVFVQVEAAVTAAGHEQVAVLRQGFREPHRRLVRLLGQICKAFRRVLEGARGMKRGAKKEG